jgi:hypothetical protein
MEEGRIDEHNVVPQQKGSCMTRWKTVALVAVLGLGFCLAGCSSLTRKNFDKIQSGMSVGQVEKILGKKEITGLPAGAPAIPDATETLTWQEKKGKSISIGFKEGHVIGKNANGL